MASSLLFITILAILTSFASSTFAKDYVVGDENGWTVRYDYEAWVKGKTFHVGDNLIFKYTPKVHNVVEVKENEFIQCEAPSSTKPLTSGEDVIKLEKPGKTWFICSIGKHCELGKQKLGITVLSSSSTPSEPSPSSPSPTHFTSAVTPSHSASVAAKSNVGTRFGWAMLIIRSLWMLMA